MNTNPNHGYLTEPRWMQPRNTIRELFSIRMWAEIASLASVIFVLWIVLS